MAWHLRVQDKSTARNPFWLISPIIFVKYAQYSPQMIEKKDSNDFPSLRPLNPTGSWAYYKAKKPRFTATTFQARIRAVHAEPAYRYNHPYQHQGSAHDHPT